MSSREEVSYPILLKHDVDYVLVIFGGLLGFSGDDINKVRWCLAAFLAVTDLHQFLWMM
jgi:dolichyl-diphosphooligosaccharide--protein glycosyltransferase